MENVTNKKIWKRVGISLGVVLGLYVILVGIRTTQLFAEEAVQKRVDAIHAIRLTMADIDGSKLPPEPDKEENDKTVAGIDVNGNYVRDDVERWIFAQYPDLKERAAWMQEAKGIGLMVGEVPNKEVFKAMLEEGSRSNICLAKYYKTFENVERVQALLEKRKAIENQILNTAVRADAFENAFKYDVGSGGVSGQQCDVFPENE